MAKDRKPATPARAAAPAGRGGRRRQGRARSGAKGGRTRPPAQRGHASSAPVGPDRRRGRGRRVRRRRHRLRRRAGQRGRARTRSSAVDEIEGVETYDYAAGQEHVDHRRSTTPSRPPVGGPHARRRTGPTAPAPSTTSTSATRTPCTASSTAPCGSPTTPTRVSDDDIDTLAELVEGESGPDDVALRRPGLPRSASSRGTTS